MLVAIFGLFSADLYGQSKESGDAGSVFGNQATTTFRDGSGALRTVTSNIVTSTVIQVAASDIKSDQSKFAAPGGQVYFQHVITNTGNGPDSFALETSASGDFVFDNIFIYADINGDGVPDDNNNLASTPQLSRNESFRFVVVGFVPGVANDGNQTTITVTGRSAFDTNETSTVSDITTVSNNAVVNVVKVLDRNEGPNGQNVTVTLRYTNTGNSAAADLTITDNLPQGMSYVPGSARWSVTGSGTELTDANQDAQGTGSQTIIYDYDETTPGEVRAVINEVNSGQSGILSFEVTINSTNSGEIENIAEYFYNDGTGDTTPRSTNSVTFVVDTDAALVGTGDTIASAPQGGSVDFQNSITNNGNASDIFDVEIGTDDFPAGTSFMLLKETNATPLLDSNNNGIPDTGPLGSGESYTIVLRVVLPGGATGGPFQVEKVITSSNDENQSITLTDELTTITTSNVDLTLDEVAGQAAALGTGVYQVGQAPLQGKTLDSGNSVTFEVYITNTSAVPDNYDLRTSTVEDFSSIQLPDNFRAVFKDAAGKTITNTGDVAAGASKQVFLEITALDKSDALPDGLDIYIRGLSPVTGSGDRLHVEVVINTERDINILPNNSGQIFPGGTVVYMHTVTNNGNVDEQNITLGTTNSVSGFTSIIYEDTNNDGKLDNADQNVNSISNLNKGDTKTLFVKVTAPQGASNGASNTTNLTVSPDNAPVNGIAAPSIAEATSVSTVVNSNVVVNKTQSKTESGPFSERNIDAAPGEIIYYRITVTNQGTESVTEVFIEDDIPAYTSYVGSSATVNGGSTAIINSQPADGDSGLVKAEVGELGAGASATLIFAVKVD